MNYADRERVLDDATSASHGRRVESTAHVVLPKSSLEMSTLLRSDWAALRTCFASLALLDTPLIGQITYSLLRGMAYVRYAVGRISFYTRHSVAPPLPLSISELLPSSTLKSSPQLSENYMAYTREALEQLIDLGSYEQVASITSAAAPSRPTNVQYSGSCPEDSSKPHDAITPYFRGIMQDTALECIQVGKSPIHSRGLFTTRALPRGTRVLVAPQRTFVDAPQSLLLLSDTYTRLSDTLHYTHPTGSLLELIMQPLPHHLLNHSCEPNCCCGLSREFWPAIGQQSIASVEAEHKARLIDLQDRIETFQHYEDANSFFTTRDVQAGEELTISYAHRIAPMFHGERALHSHFIVCRCGSRVCRHFVYKQTDEVLQHLAASGGKGFRRWGLLSRVTGPKTLCRQFENTGRYGCEKRDMEDFGQLLLLGYDDETVMLSLLRSKRLLMRYMLERLAPSRRTASKRELLLCYRHVFKLLNETVPQDFSMERVTI
ncbi:SET domain [Trypanosoma vivax]|nr:SET domain [Trypanosoma vivax]